MADELNTPVEMKWSIQGELQKLVLEQASFGTSRQLDFTRTKGAASSPGQARVSDVSVTSTLSAASPDIFLKMCKGDILDEAEITTFNGAKKLHTLKLKKLGISSYSLSMQDGLARESFTIAFNEMEAEHEKIDDDGNSQGTSTVKFSNDRARHVAQNAK
jgi:type VI protein secretion system component Hcp